MKEENQIIVISGFMGFTIGVIVMLMVNYHNEVKLLQKYDIILENVVEEVYKHEGLYEYQNMARRIIIDKYEGNTHYNIHVIDSFGQEHHLGYSSVLSKSFRKEVERRAQEIWENEVKRDISPLSRAIKECIEIDRKSGILTGNRDNLD